MSENLSGTRKAAFTALILIIAGTVSVFVAGVPVASPAPSGIFLTPGGASALIENFNGTGAAVVFKALAALLLVLILGKKSFSSAVPLAAVVFLIPAGGEALTLPLVAAMAFAPALAVIAAALILPFFSKLALVCILLAILIRIIMSGRTASTLLPAAGLISPPLLASIFSGDILLPFYLSVCAFPPYSPAMILSPLFALFVLSALWLFVHEKPDTGKVSLAFVSFFFGPLTALSAVIPARDPAKTSASLKVLFIIPLVWALAIPQKQASLTGGFKEILISLRGTGAKIACPPQFHDEAARLTGGEVFPSASVKELKGYYSMLPLTPPFLGHAVPDADILFTEAYYPEKSSMRPFSRGWKIASCSNDHALFVSEKFLASTPDFGHLNNYSPYTVLPPDPEAKKLALAEVETLLAEDPGFYQGLRDAGKLLLDMGEPQKAEHYFNDALKVRKSAEIYNDLGVSLANSGKPEAAMNAYLEAMKLSPRDIYPRMNYAAAALSTGKTDEGKMVLEDLVRAYPTFYPAIRMLSQVYGKEGNIDRSRETLRLIPKELRTPDENSLVGDGR
ncbi:MAG TPA: hypothetical protein PK747_01645 [Acidobacteriota bacterium]|nr:hypothetical protein [Acidobacteriota bacterium]HNT17072.1 hypothetical protein [Acidobacteriota bacterium]HPA26084.1 hypothetical protein [Acidobacteriota bacterium]HQO19283.1 hypothetical protein [Acidobacteriota bacterium]HQQ46095.1 hypothetical protein [Acidobacteriota bacterium]